MATKTPTATAKNSITHAGRTIYLNNKELSAEIIISKEQGRMSDALAKMLMLLCTRYAQKGNFVNYSFKEDMISFAMMMLVRTWSAYNPEKSNNPFSFYTQCVHNSYVQYLNQEKRQRVIRDEILIDQGMCPSQGYSDSRASGSPDDDEQDFEIIQIQADILKKDEFDETAIERDETGKLIEPVTENDNE